MGNLVFGTFTIQGADSTISKCRPAKLVCRVLPSGENSKPGYCIALAGSNSPWYSITMALSLDSGQKFVESSSTNVQAVVGELVTTLVKHKPEIPDTYNCV
ncbi:hypothetical protein P3339_13145 [Microbulbifer sp. MLAF003]|uniref:hypothetical protein n=1 Tax=unclassified Microbulbifer TaxID=2619833 RepID=UPI0024AD5280|nr:hypothetical protein [Microbulbifer sp. MLAF003]WHI49421.1 hypothetical protein P3339_13145 [Microbulbifer sp. MLAF003]